MSTTTARPPGITLSQDQSDAVDAIEAWHKSPKRCFALGGLAGTGKSTIASVIAERFRDRGVRMKFATPTNKAAVVLRSKGVMASTIHQLLYRLKGTVVDDRGNEVPIFEDKDWQESCDVLAVDEASMITTKVFNDTMARGVRVLWIGDHGQLAPVGGNPRIMERAAVRLERIHRQAADSPILKAAYAVREGQPVRKEWAGEHLRIGRVRHIEHAVDVAKRSGVDQIVVATNKERHAANHYWRGTLSGKPPCEGERVVCLMNNRDCDIWNGQVFVVEKVRRWGEEYGVFDLRSEDDGELRPGVPIYVRGMLLPHCERREFCDGGANLFAFANAMTAHKLQGSQYGHVMVLDQPFAEPERWRYTAFTRAEHTLTIARYA